MRIAAAVISFIGFVLWLSAPQAATIYDSVFATPGSIVCASNSICANMGHVRVQAVTISAQTVTGLYGWQSVCPQPVDGASYIQPTGTTGCFAIEGRASPSGTAGSIVVGSTAIGNGANTRILYDNSGTLGEYTITGSGTVVAMQTSPALVTPSLGVATGTSLALGGATIGSDALAVTGSTTTSGRVNATQGVEVTGALTSGPSGNGIGLSAAGTVGIYAGGSLTARVTGTGINNTNIGATTTGSGAFTTLSASSTLTTNVTGTANNCLQANSSGVVSGVGGACASGTLPTRQALTSGTGATYTTPANTRQIRVRFVGGGGGGGGSGSGLGMGGTGGTTIFNSINAIGGSGGGVTGGAGGTGGTGGSSPTTVRFAGNGGISGQVAAVAANAAGGAGAGSFFGGAGLGGPGSGAVAGSSGAANTGGGGGGAGLAAQAGLSNAGSGAGAGEYVEYIINSPAGSYTYTVGAGGTAGTAGTSGNVGGAGGTGVIIVDEYY